MAVAAPYRRVATEQNDDAATSNISGNRSDDDLTTTTNTARATSTTRSRSERISDKLHAREFLLLNVLLYLYCNSQTKSIIQICNDKCHDSCMGSSFICNSNLHPSIPYNIHR